MAGRRLSREERRDRILAAGAEVFATSGYDAAGLREVARRAGISTPVLYDHFWSKADLYATLLRRQVDSLLDSWGGWSEPPHDATPFALFHSRAEAVFSWVDANELGWLMIFGETPAEEAVAREQRHGQARAAAQLARLFAAVPRLDLTASLDRGRANEALAEASTSALDGVVRWWLNNRDVPRDIVVSLLVDLLWHGLGRLAGNQEDSE
jgi:AcrR family transcriptional regulator